MVLGCNVKTEDSTIRLEPNEALKFTVKKVDDVNIHFANTVRESKHLNYLTFPYIYAGAGVAVGDINNDGLSDIFFVGNDVKNGLFLNKGDLKFEDISEKSRTRGKEKLRWSTGVTMADVNADGLLDIYVCVSGPSPDKQNLLYINNGDLTFTESAKAYGLNDSGYSNQATFFDYDNDGDLDMYLASYPPCDFQNPNSFYVEKMNTVTDEESDQLYENIGNSKFINATGKSGVFNYGLSLNASVSDFNNDGWYDVYVSNDFNSPDFLFINQKNGTFKNEILTYMNHTSNFGMGSDAADFNNDGNIDLMQADMMSASNFKQKRNMSSMSPEYFNEAVELGLHHQYMRNSLQMNNGNGFFSDIAEYAGVANTDWTWSTLFADLNNDGWKDIFITNGMRKSVNNKDFMAEMDAIIASGRVPQGQEYLLFKNMPVEPVSNKVFVNNGDLSFSSVIDVEGLSYYGFTHGAAYADLDLDGDLDIVLNNLDKKAMIVENQSTGSNYLRFKLKGENENSFGIGAKIEVINGNQKQYQELIPTRGYLSSVEPILHFGMGKVQEVDTIRVTWPSGKEQVLVDIDTNEVLEIAESDAKTIENEFLKNDTNLMFVEDKNTGLDFIHKENDFDDFAKQVLLPHQLSKFGPAIAKGDINGDGLDDLYLGGAKDQAGIVYMQKSNGNFEKRLLSSFETDKIHEDIGASLFDADMDGDLDLYVVSGGNEFKKDSEYYKDRLYINNGLGQFTINEKALPNVITSGSKVKPFDYDEDGDMDLFIAGRHTPWDYPSPATSILLENNKGIFTNVNEVIAPDLKDIGLVTDMVWSDYNNDGEVDMVLTGEWMPITILEQKNGIFNKISSSTLAETEGWWYSVKAVDIDNDGDDDYIAGNLGLNYKYKASLNEPFELYYSDFDSNGTKDLALGYYENNVLYPLRGKQCSTEQIPGLKDKFKSYDAFAKANFNTVYDIEQSENLIHLKAKTFASTIFINNGEGTFEMQKLPNMAQLSSINTIVVKDYDKDGVKDIIVAGNLFSSEVETPRNDASMGMFLKGVLNDKGYTVKPITNSGLKLNKDLKSLVSITLGHDELLIGANNDDTIQVFKLLN